MCHSRWSFGQSASGLCVSGLLGHDSSTLSTCAHIESHCNCLDAVMAVSSRRSSVSKPPESVRYYYEPSRSKSKASISVSSAAKSKHESSTLDKRPRLQRSVSTSQSQSQSQSTPLDDKALDKDKDKDKKQHRRTSSFLGSIFRPSIPTPAPVSSPTPRVRTAECLTCGSDDVPVTRSAKLPCGHRMCNSCLRRIFTMSIKDPQHMPPKCCNQDHIPLKHVDHLFDDKFKILWNTKYQEYTTKNRVYCPAKGCGQWIKPSNMHKLQGRKYGRCPRCKTKVCTLCNNKLHTSGDCPKDPETKRLVDLAKEKGWQRCYNCKAMVELKEGCNHMTCRCGSDFCMLCASPWKTCECPWFNNVDVPDQDRLDHMRVPETVVNLPRHDRHDRNDRNEPNDRNDRHEPRRTQSRNPPMTGKNLMHEGVRSVPTKPLRAVCPRPTSPKDPSLIVPVPVDVIL
jgi:ariadne-1